MTARWLTPDDCAAYIGVRVHQLPKLVKAGKVPEPSRHLGPRSPRWDRDELDRLFGTAARSSGNREVVNDAVQQILAAGRSRQPKAPRGRVNPGIPLPAQSAPVVPLRRG